MSTSFQYLFTPIFIIVSLAILICGIVLLQVMDRLFAGSQNLSIIRIFFIAIIINIVILVFLIMSFSRIRIQKGPQGPIGNKGNKGDTGNPGGLTVCGVQYQTIEEKKALEKSLNYLDLKPPLINLN
jgi:hypothetical protein